MAYDGKILARARALKEEQRSRAEAESARREAEAYTLIPELRSIDARLARLMADMATKALGGGDMAETVASVRSSSEALSAKRAELLREKGLPEDYTEPRFDCGKCRDTGYVLGKPCECLKAAYSAEAVRELSSMLDLRGQCFENFDLSLYDAARNADGDSPRSIMSATYEYCKKYASDFKETSPNLLFRGGTGLGKTFLSACIAKLVSEKDCSVVYDTAVSVFEAFESQKFDRSDPGGETAARVRRYLSCDLLILDDLGTEMTTGFTQSALYNLINSRLLSGHKTIISTNLGEEDVRRRYTPQIVSRLEGDYICLNFVGRDIRAIKRERR